jgi:hypothetical protein
MIANMTIAHLSACRYVFHGSKLPFEREKIRLNMGVLKMLGEHWPAGNREYKTKSTIAREILALKEEEIHIPQETPVLSLGTNDYSFPDFDFNWGSDIFTHSQGPVFSNVAADTLVYVE